MVVLDQHFSTNRRLFPGVRLTGVGERFEREHEITERAQAASSVGPLNLGGNTELRDMRIAIETSGRSAKN